MGYERYRQGQRDPRDLGADSNDTYSSARDYEAAGAYDRDGYGQRGSAYGQGGFQNSDYGRSSFDQRSSGYYGGNDWNDRGASQRSYGGDYRGSYAHDGHRFNDVEDYGRQQQGRGYGRQDYGRQEYGRQDWGRQPQGYDRDRGFLDRAGDEVRSWFGDREAERRREQDARFDQMRDADYHSWRQTQIAALDRDYDEYRRENRSKFENEFSSWRTERQGQRNSLNQVAGHMDVVGSDGSHVGTVDKVRGDRIILTKNDQDAGGRHHSIPSRWIQSVDDKVTLRKTADEAKREWRDEERNQAFFSEGRGDRSIGDDPGAHMLDRSFSGTYRS
jgi:hypothetical protein